MGIHINITAADVAEFCKRNHICSLSLFGSVLRDDFAPDSDVDVLVEFDEDHSPGLFGLVELQEEMSKLLGRKADLVERRAVEESANYIRRRHILQSLETVYVAR